MEPEDLRQRLAEPPANASFSNDFVPPSAPDRDDSDRDDALSDSISASYFLLRRGLALLGFAFPIVLWLGAGPADVQTSISAYYHHDADGPLAYGMGTMRDVFVGVLWAIGTFLFFYKGYSRAEDWALDVAGLAAVLVALFPMDWPPAADTARTVTAHVHYASAVTFFFAIAFVCLFLSGDTLKLMRDADRRRSFERTYRVLGALMIIVPLVVLLLHYLSRADRSLVVLLIEIAGIYVFSAFWLVKGREIAILERQRAGGA